jgi:hypothetical protein
LICCLKVIVFLQSDWFPLYSVVVGQASRLMQRCNFYVVLWGGQHYVVVCHYAWPVQFMLASVECVCLQAQVIWQQHLVWWLGKKAVQLALNIYLSSHTWQLRMCREVELVLCLHLAVFPCTLEVSITPHH